MSAAVIHELRTPIYVETPKGDGLAYAWIWEHQDKDLLWMVCIEETRQFWTFRNPEIRLCWNYTMGLGRKFPLPTHKKHPVSGTEARGESDGSAFA